jgi:hypothetical protein
MDQQAGQARASAQRQALDERHNADLAGSRAQAAAAASGAGATDPTVVNIQGDIAKEGEYRYGMALYNGEEYARGLEGQANAKRASAKAAQFAGYMNAASTVLSAGGKHGQTLLDKYG